MTRHAHWLPGSLGSKSRTRRSFFRPSIEILEDRLTPTTLPAGFIDTPVASGFVGPTAMEFSPDGRLWVLEQSGNVKLMRSDGTTFTAIDLAVDSAGERGLLGIAFDPNFNANKFVYLYYTNPNPGTAPWATGVHNQISRFTVDDTNPLQPTLGSEAPILDLNNLISATNHNGGAIHFGIDGMLYANTGDNVQNFVGPDTITYRVSQTLANMHGKQLRIDVSRFNSGAATRNDTDVGALIPANNPFVGQATGINQLIYVLGLRNPFTFAVQPGTGRMLINDVGENSWEEINDSIAGANFGWRGGSSDGFGHPPPAFAPGTYHEPLLAYAHSGTVSQATGVAVVGGTFYNPTTAQFPSSYVGMYFYQDLLSRWIRYFDPNNPNAPGTPDGTSFGFATNTPGGLRDLKVDSAGRLFYLAGGDGAVHRISFEAPMITSHPANQTVDEGQPATFNVTANGQALSYQWQHFVASTWTNVGSNSPTLTINPVNQSDAGSYRVIVSNTFGSETSNTATLTVTVPELVVDSIIPTPTGFTAQFNKPFDPTVINLYDGLSTFGSADVTLVKAATPTIPIRGSLVIEPANTGFTFVRSGVGNAGILAAGTYNVTLRSASDGFKDVSGGLLDGNDDGTTGDNFVSSFNIATTPIVILSIPDFARGPDSASAIKIPNHTGTGIPITLQGASGVTDVTFDLPHNPALLNITGTVNPAGGTFALVSNVSGVASFAFHSASPLSGDLTLGQIVATVPNAAISSYKATHLLILSNIASVGVSATPVANNGLHVNAYFADTFGDASISGGDASLVGRVAVALDTGFRAYPLVDPRVLGDFNDNGFPDSTDVTMLMQRLSGVPTPQIPNPPPGLGVVSALGSQAGSITDTSSQFAQNSSISSADQMVASQAGNPTAGVAFLPMELSLTNKLSHTAASQNAPQLDPAYARPNWTGADSEIRSHAGKPGSSLSKAARPPLGGIDDSVAELVRKGWRTTRSTSKEALISMASEED